MGKRFKICSLVCLLSCSIGLSSCTSPSSSSSTEDRRLSVNPLTTIYAKTPKTAELTAKYYEDVISKVTDSDTWDGPKLISKGTLVKSTDGDTSTFTLNTSKGKEDVSIRYCGIDTPELHHPSKGSEAWGLAAKQYVDYWFDKAEKENLTIVVEGGVDSTSATYEREVGYVWVGSHCLNLELLEIGLCMPLVESPDNDRHSDKNTAIYNHRGSDEFPNALIGDLKFHCMSFIDPNWSEEQNNNTNIETNPACLDINYKYNFDFEHEGKLTEIPLCVEDVLLCIVI